MPSKFYVEGSGAAAISPTDNAAWELVAEDFVRVPSALIAAGTALAARGEAEDEDVDDKDLIIVQAIAGPFPAQTYLAQTIDWCFQVTEVSSLCNLSLTMDIRALAADDSAVLGALVSMRRDTTEAATTLTSRYDSVTSTEVICAESHYLAFEIGLGGNPTSIGHQGSIRIGTTAAGGDLAEVDNDTSTDKRGWIEFANAITTTASTGTIAATLQKALFAGTGTHSTGPIGSVASILKAATFAASGAQRQSGQIAATLRAVTFSGNATYVPLPPNPPNSRYDFIVVTDARYDPRVDMGARYAPTQESEAQYG